MQVIAMSNGNSIRKLVRDLTVFTCLFLTLHDLKGAAQYSGTRAMLAASGVSNPSGADLEAFASLVRRKAIFGLLIAAAVTVTFVVLFHWWRLPPFDWK